MMKEIYAIKNLLFTATLAISCIILGACSSGSSTGPEPEAPEVTGQAIDGYIVGGTIYCDGIENGLTEAAGRYSCPNGTKIIKVVGGVDTGFDESATTSNVLFNGVIFGPADYKYITPMTTLITELSGGEENFDSSKLDSSIQVLKNVLGISTINPEVNPAENIAAARLNAQLDLIAGTFSNSRDEYKKVMGSLANLIKNKSESSETINVNGKEVSKFEDTIRDLKDVIIEQHTDITINVNIDVVVVLVLNGVTEIEEKDDHSDFPTITDPINYSLTFSTTGGIVRFIDQDDLPFSYSVADYENDDRDGQGKHVAVLSRGIKRISLDKSLIEVKKTVTDASIDVAFSIQGDPKLGDSRALNVIARDIKVSMVKGDSSSIRVKIPDETVWYVEGINIDGTSTKVDVEKDGDRIFSSNEDGINLKFDYVTKELEKKGYPDLTREIGNFRVTCIMSGLALGRTTGTDTKYAGVYIVDLGDGSNRLAGQGLRGFVTIQE